jgi:hypothetical protein
MAINVNPLTVPAAQQRKAIVAAIVAGVGAAVAALSAGGNWWQAVLAAVAPAAVAYLGTFGATNDAAPVAPPAE